MLAIFLPALADHCPDDLLIGGAPERTLAGVDVYNDSVVNAVAKLGPPTTRREHKADPSSPGGSVIYEWTRGSTAVRMMTLFYVEKSSGKLIESIEAITLQGDSGRTELQTGRGARLGDSRRMLRKLYGSKYYRGSIRGSGPDDATITFCFEDETALEFLLNDDGKVMQIFLATSGE